MMLQRTNIAILTLVCTAVVVAPAFAGSTPAEKCAAAKMKAVGKKCSARAKCYAKALSTSEAVSQDCLDSAEEKFVTAFTKAESGSDCLHANDVNSLELKLDQCLADVVGDIGCGNGVTEGDEQCDDGNLVDGDGCSSSCQYVCGDGVVVAGEQCDDGNLVPTDGCSADCHVEIGWMCAGSPSTCQTTCGDGLLVGAEQCDDGDVTSGDGCNAACQVEPNYNCDGGSPTACFPCTPSGGFCGASSDCCSFFCDQFVTGTCQ